MGKIREDRSDLPEREGLASQTRRVLYLTMPVLIVTAIIIKLKWKVIEGRALSIRADESHWEILGSFIFLYDVEARKVSSVSLNLAYAVFVRYDSFTSLTLMIIL